MKKELLIPLVIIILSIAFIIVSIIVYITNANSNWISRKIKIGALLLTLSGSTIMPKEINKCYEMPPGRIFIGAVKEEGTSNFIIDLKKGNEINLQIREKLNSKFSFLLRNSNQKEVQTGNVIIKNIKTTEGYNASIILNKDLKSGIYDIYFYKCSKEKIKETNFLRRERLHIL
jgi:hypothetical protein